MHSTNGCAALAQTELGVQNLKQLDFIKDSDEFAQFAVAYKNRGTKGQLPIIMIFIQTQEMLFGHLLVLHSQIMEV